MKRALAVIAIIGAVVAAAWLVERARQDRRYRQLLSDGETAMRLGQTYVAIESFSGALALRPASMVALYHRGEAYAAQGQDESAIRDLKAAWRLAPDAPQPLEALGQLFDRRGNPAQAADWYGLATDRLQDADPNLLYALALARYRAGTPVTAREPLRRALVENPSFAEAHYLLGLVYRDSQNADEAIASLEQAIRLAPTLVAAREELADLYRERGRADDERRQLEALTESGHQFDRRWALAMAEVRSGRFDEAIAMLAPDADHPGADSRLALALGRVYLARAETIGDRASVLRARSWLEKALAGTARRSEGLALFGRALFLDGDLAGAERLLQDAAATSPVDPEAFGFLADAAERLSHPAIAADALLSLDALEGDTASGEVRAARARRVGSLAMQAADWRLASDRLTFAVETGYADAMTLGQLARARWQAGDRLGAQTALTRALTLDGRSADLLRLARQWQQALP